MNYVVKSVKVSGFTKEHPAAELRATGQLMDVLSRLMLLNALAALIPSRCLP